MISLAQISKSYDNVQAVQPLDLTFEAGATTVLIGPSGCGKSTLLRLVTGLAAPDSGAITIDGQVLAANSLPALRRRMGYVIQDGGLFPHLTARDNIALMADHLGQTNSDIDARLQELAGLCHFPPDLLGRYPLELSGGQRQRVALMRALMLAPDILLLDEPLGALDPLIRADLQQDLRDIFRSLGKTVILVTHDMHEAAFFADRLVLMHDGQIVQAGTTDDLLHRPADPFVTRFINAQRRDFDGGAI